MTMPSQPAGKIPIIIVTYRDIYAWVARLDKDEQAMYDKYSAVVRMCEPDMQSIGVSRGGKVKLSNGAGSVTVKVQLDSKCPKGYGFMPMSHIPNQLTSYEPGKLPNFKWIQVEAEAIDPKGPAANAPV